MPASIIAKGMSPTRLSIALCVAAAFLAVPGCETQAGKLPPPKSTTTLALTPDVRTELSTISLGSAIKLVLPLPTQGSAYAWEILSNNIKVLQQLGPIKANVDASGKTISYSVEFQAIHTPPNRSIITIAAVRPGVSESEPSDLFQVTVGVKPAAQP
jgi:hypothetical protein